MADLNKLESWLPADILRKGEDYWSNQQVVNLAHERNLWVGKVQGAKEYTVEVTLDGPEVEHWSCDCPYDWGPVCKHVAAVLLAIRSQEGTGPSATAPKTDAKAVNPIPGIIEQLDPAELQHLLNDFAERHLLVHAHILGRHAHLSGKVPKIHYRQLIQQLIKGHYDETYRIVNRVAADRLGRDLMELLRQASPENAQAYVYLCEEVIRQIAKAMEDADDSTAAMSTAVDTAFKNLFSLTRERENVPTKVLNYLFRFALRESQQEIYQDWEWGGVLQALACEAAGDVEQAGQLIESLDQFIATAKQKKFLETDLERAELLKLDLLERFYSSQEAAAYLKTHIQYTFFRQRALEQALEEKDYQLVRQLAEAGIAQDTERDLPGLVTKWKEWLTRLEEMSDQRKA